MLLSDVEISCSRPFRFHRPIAKKIWGERDHEVILSTTLEMPKNMMNKDSELLVWDGLGARKEEGD